MSRARIVGVAAGLLAGLLFYWAHRSSLTLSNRMLQWLCGPAWYAAVRAELHGWLPLPAAVRGSLPSALWCFIVGAGCGGWNLRLGRRGRVPLVWLAAGVNAGWELVQAAGWTNGRADPLDAVAGVLGCALARRCFGPATQSAELAPGFNWRTGVTLACLCSMGLAHVWR